MVRRLLGGSGWTPSAGQSQKSTDVLLQVQGQKNTMDQIPALEESMYMHACSTATANSWANSLCALGQRKGFQH